MGLEKREDKPYVSILSSDGSLRLVVPEGTEGAVKREYTVGKGKDEKTGVKYELVFKSLDGMISDVAFHDGDYGKLLQVTVTDEEAEEGAKEFVLSVNTSTNFGEDLMKKLPNIDFEQPVKFVPYSFEDERGKQRRGVTVIQNDEKVQSFFQEYDEKTKKTTNLNKYPDPEGDTKEYDADDWKVYFTKARKFLVKYTEKEIVPKFSDF